MMNHHLCRAALLLLAISLPAARPVPAAVDEVLSTHTLATWATKDGLPSGKVHALAEDADGYLWVGTSGGLARFDGLRFTTIEAVGRILIPALCAGRNGVLWVGYGYGQQGGVIRIERGAIRRYTSGDGLAEGAVAAIVEDGRGRVWAGGRVGLHRLVGDRWQRVELISNAPEVAVSSLYEDRTGAVLVGTGVGVFRVSSAGDSFQRVSTFDDSGRGVQSMSEDASGHLFVADGAVGFRELTASQAPVDPPQHSRGTRVLHDRSGDLWVATMASGLWRVRPGAGGAASVRTLPISGGRSLIEDRHGNLWVGGVEGLFRLSQSRVTALNIGVVTSVKTTAIGDVWAATDTGLLRYPMGGAPPVRASDARVRAFAADARGDLWVATDADLRRISIGDRGSRWAATAGVAWSEVTSMASSRDGALWLTTRRQGLLRWRDGRVIHEFGGLARRANMLYPDRSDRLWFSTTDGRLGLLDAAGVVRSFGPREGLGPGPYYVYEDSRRITWVGGAVGLAWLNGERFVEVLRANPLSLIVFGIVEDDDADLWLSTSQGIAWVRRGDLGRAVATPAYRVQSEIFDASDGLAGLPVPLSTLPNVARTADGRVWFVTGRGLTVVEPARVKGLSGTARVRIDAATADGRPLGTTDGATLAARTRRLQIQYGALDLTAPQKIQFQYRLEGFDSDWIDAGSRNEAVYSELPSRQYRFRVRAANGLAADSEAEWRFFVPPMFYETRWFAGSSAAIMGLAVWGALRLRLRRHRRRFALLLQERVRLSREMHDTLLQSLVGAALQFEAVSGGSDLPASARQRLNRARRQIEEYIREARQSIWNLRSPLPQDEELAGALRRAGEEIIAGTAIELHVSVEGSPHHRASTVDEQLFRIGQEAIRNAVRHSGAERIHVALQYQASSVMLRVADNGCGFDASRVAAGHLGLISMRERAEEIQGVFIVTSAAGAGTAVEVFVSLRASAQEYA